jgi:hypothetical protein
LLIYQLATEEEIATEIERTRKLDWLHHEPTEDDFARLAQLKEDIKQGKPIKVFPTGRLYESTINN